MKIHSDGGFYTKNQGQFWSWLFLVLVCGVLLGTGGKVQAETIRYIDNTATGAGDGTSWTNAWTSFSDALTGCIAPAASDDVIVYYKNGTYQENTSNSGYFKISGDFLHAVTFRHDPDENNGVSTTVIVPKGSTTSHTSNMRGILISNTTKNIVFEDLTFSAKKVVLDTMDATTDWVSSDDLTLSINDTTYQNLPSDPNPNSTAGLNFTKTGTSSDTVSTTKTINVNALGSSGYVYFSMYIKDMATLEKLASTGAVAVRAGSDPDNYRTWIYDTSGLNVGWNYLVKASTNIGTPLDQSWTYLYVEIKAINNEATWNPGDVIIDDIRTQFGVPLLIASTGLANDANITQNITFKRCDFIQYANLAYGAVYSYPYYVDESTPSVSDITFDACNFSSHSQISAVTFYKSNPFTDPATTRPYGPLTFIDSDITNTYRIGGGLTVHNSSMLTVKNSNITSEASPLYINTDYLANLTGVMVNAVIEDSNFLQTNSGSSGHGVFLGYNTPESSIVMRRCNISFPNNPSGLALILKASYNVIVESTTVSGARFVLKSPGSGNVIRNSTLIGSLSSSGALTTGYSIVNSIFKATQERPVFMVDSDIWGDNNLFDYNWYDVSDLEATYPFGAFSSDMSDNLTSFSDMLNVWVASGNPLNDLNSSTGDSLFVNFPTNLNLEYRSFLIDSGSSISGLGPDVLGNPRYGVPDIGAYEYQPPHTIGANGIDISAGARVFVDGKFRDFGTVSGNKADLAVAPESGEFDSYTATEARPHWLDITTADEEEEIIWETHRKKWKESSATLGETNTLHMIGDGEAGKSYSLRIDGSLAIENITSSDCVSGICTADENGQITFLYTGGYSEHTFELIDDIAPVLVVSSPEEGETVSGDDTITFTDSEQTAPQCSIDNANWVSCQSSVTSFSDLTGWEEIEESDTFTLYMRDTDSSGNTGTIQVDDLIKADTQAPVRSGGSPGGELASSVSSATLSITTNESATCKYSTVAGMAYASMNGSFFTENRTTHSVVVSGLVSGNSYSFYVRCQDQSGNANDTEYLISFSVGNEVQDDEDAGNERDLNIHKVKATSTENSITITWETDHNTKTSIRYGTDKNLKEKSKDSNKKKKHEITIGNLLPGTEYYFRIKAEDSHGNEDRSRIHSIATQAALEPQPVSIEKIQENTADPSEDSKTDDFESDRSREQRQAAPEADSNDEGADKEVWNETQSQEQTENVPQALQARKVKWWNPFSWFSKFSWWNPFSWF